MAATKERKRHWLKAFVSIAVTLVAMPLTHILARALKDGTAGVEQFYAGMGMGLFGLLMVIIGVFIKGDVKQALLGLFGGMFYWMGAIDFLFMYYANRFGTQAQLDPVTGEIVSRPEYLILPSTFGFWAMTMMLYLFCTANGCNFLNWWQRLFFGKHKKEIAARPMTRHTSIVAFMEVITMLWTCYLVLMFCYDERFFWQPSSGDIACRDAGLHRFAVHVRQAVALCFVGHEPAFRFRHRNYLLDRGRGLRPDSPAERAMGKSTRTCAGNRVDSGFVCSNRALSRL